MANSRYGVRQHCQNFLHLPEEERFVAAREAMLKTGCFTWPDKDLVRWLRPETHEAHEARQEALRDKRARDRSAAR